MSLIQQRRDTAANWTAADPTLAAGEFGVETDTGKVKVGDGHTAWTALGYVTDQSEIGNLDASKITSGTLNAARLPDLSGTYAAVTEPVAAAEQARAEAAEALLLPKSQVGAANGAAALDSGGHVPVGQVPDLSGSYVALGADSTVTGHVSIERGYAVGDYALKVGTGAKRGAPTDALTVATGGAGPLTGVYKYAYTDTDLVGETTPGAAVSYTASAEGILVTVPLPRPGTVARNVYRTSAGGSDYKRVWSFGGGYDSHQTQFVDTMTDASRGVAAPATDTTQSWSLLSQPDGLTYVSGSPSTPTADDFALLIADGRQGTSWCIDSYGPIVTRTALGTNFVAYHTGTVGAAFQAFYTPTLCPVQGGATPQQTLIANGGGGLSIYQRAGASSALDVEGFGNALAIRAAIGDANPTFWIDSTGKASYGPGASSGTDTNWYRKGSGVVGTDYRLAVGNASGTSGTLTVGPGPNDAGVPTFKVTSAGGTFNVTVAAAGGTTLAVTGGTAFAFNQGPTTRLAFSTAGSVLVGAGAPALTATDGFPYLPANAGAPTGTPTTQSGFVPFYYDTTNHKLWIYDAGWKGVVVS